MRKVVSCGCAMGLAGLFALVAPVTAYAERPEVDCNSLSEADMKQFYDLSGKCGEAAGAKNLEEALTLCKQAMSICTSDAYTEYTLGRLYQLTEDIPSACYHFELLLDRPASYQKENADIYKELKKNHKSIKNKCSELGTLEIVCKMPGVELSISGLNSMSNFACPFYGKVPTGSYPVEASKEGYQPRKDSVVVSAEGGKLSIPALTKMEYAGFLRVKCPKGASKFVLTSSDGKVDEYVCPWEGEVPADTYKIRLGGTDASEDVTVTVASKARQEYTIPSVNKSSCSAAPASNTTAHAAGIFAILAMIGAAVFRRRRAQ